MNCKSPELWKWIEKFALKENIYFKDVFVRVFPLVVLTREFIRINYLIHF